MAAPVTEDKFLVSVEVFLKPSSTERIEDVKFAVEMLTNLEEMSDSPISSMDQSPISYPYCQTNSETSGFSEQMADDFNSCPSETNSPVCWPGTGRSPYSPTLSRFGGMRRNEKMEKNDNEKPTYYGFEQQCIKGDTPYARMYTDVGVYYAPGPVLRGKVFDGAEAVRRIESWLIKNHGLQQQQYAVYELKNF
ncbi:hypothetical protein Tco_1380400 [Tanacetum coccineum]